MSQICLVCSSHNSVLFSPFMTYHKIVNNSNMTGASSGTGTAYHFEKPEFIPNFKLMFVMLNL